MSDEAEIPGRCRAPATPGFARQALPAVAHTAGFFLSTFSYNLKFRFKLLCTSSDGPHGM